MDKLYDAKSVEAKWYAWWESRGLFHMEPDAAGEPYCVMIPPPNVTGILHMGHALNNTIQDVLVRWRRMQGRNVLWVPGTDHAGIATQNVVEKALRREGRTRDDLGRDDFIARVWAWREEYGGTIVRQLRKLGASCDWRRERFTMDAGLSAAVVETFCRLYDEGLIYRGHYIVNWCPRCHTALADEESEHRETRGQLWHIRYPVAGGGFVTVATTRPETMLGDTALAVNPADARYEALRGQTVTLPLLGRTLRVVADDYVDPAFGTGVVKITPAHDPNDFLVAQRHGLESINVMEGDGTMNAAAGPYAGLDRFACRKRVVADLEAQGLLEKVEPHTHAVGHCYRCDTVVEPRLSKQWFVRMRPLAEPAIAAVREGRVRFHPARWEKVYLEWMENIRDWCISRQIWWGHRIPVFTCGACSHEWAARQPPTVCPRCAADAARLTQDEDVLDTWFSSWLWPFSTLGWPQGGADLACYYPTHDLVTASEIIFFWVARMIMAGYKFMGDAPFRDVHIHGTVRDAQGRKMSKSLGNSLDPLEIIERTSADALRFSLMMITATGQDVFVDPGKFDIGRNFGTKIWNAARFLKLHMEQTPDCDWRALALAAVPPLDAATLTDDDRHLLARGDALVATVTEHLERARFQDAALAIYDVVWSAFCDWYLEYAKGALHGGEAARRRQVLTLMTRVFSQSLRTLHPFMPFLTEELWHAMGYGTPEESIMRAPWPQPLTTAAAAQLGLSEAVTDYVEAKHELITAGRALRAEHAIAPSKAVVFAVQVTEAANARRLRGDHDSLCTLLRAERVDISEAGAAPEAGVPVKLGSISLPLAGLVDPAAEIQRAAAELAKARQFLAGLEAKLANADFVARAPAAVVAQQRAKCDEVRATVARLSKLAAVPAEKT